MVALVNPTDDAVTTILPGSLPAFNRMLAIPASAGAGFQ
jgi:hypothetical protein